MIENTEDVYNDQWLFIFEVIKKFKINQQKTPIFLLGRSFGGLIATNMAATPVGQAMFSGLSLLTPYYRLWTEKLYKVYNAVKCLSKVRPNYEFKSEFQEDEPGYWEEWHEIFEDPRSIYSFTAKTASLWVEEQEKAREIIKELELPMLFIEAEKETVVSNAAIKEFAQLAKNPRN